MLLLTIIGLIAVVSVMLALHSLKNLHKMEEVGRVQKELTRGKVIFHSDSVSSSSK